MVFNSSVLTYKVLNFIKNKLFINQNLCGDRDIEWSFVAANLGQGPGNALDFGCRQTYLGLMAAQAGYKTIALDLEPVVWPYHHNNLQFIQGDILKIDLPKNHFDLIINSSTVEHVGLSGRYQIKNDIPVGDLQAMQKMLSLLKPQGKMILTIPIGQDAVFPPLHRVYGQERLPKLLQGYTILKKEFWLKNQEKKWMKVKEEKALSTPGKEDGYGLGCFVLQKVLK